ncbi:hypothetical protein LZ554_000210 [Drepanopeziza brunnea f. sp. 'monogermtubi']|nr:hypothetical protein LZ554_000210 [Drepanopeziza brunnea f. sp. 'monogermtubi']
MTEKPFIIFVLGPPASGKGTLGKRLAAAHNLHHLSVGDYLRYLIQGPLKDQADIVDAVRSGGTRGLVSGDVIVSLLIDKIKEEMTRGQGAFLLDGFPRNLEQEKAFREMMKAEFDTHTTPDLTLLISCPREIARARYLERKRGDDSVELFDKRYSDYEQRDSMVVDLYRESLVEVKAEAGVSVDQSYTMLIEELSGRSPWQDVLTSRDNAGV